MADHFSPEASFETLKKNTITSISSYFPWEGRKHDLVLKNIWVDDKLHTDDIHDQAATKDKEGTWGVPIRADLQLVEKSTGRVVDTKKGAILARLPKLTSRYGFIVNGSEYQVDHLFRLKSGAYTRVQDNGDLETEFNLKEKASRNNFSVKLDRQKQKLSLKYGDAHIDLYPILKVMGVSDEQLEHQWGKKLFDANKSPTDKKFHRSLETFFQKTSDEDHAVPKTPEEYAKYVIGYFDKTGIRPDTTKLTLGKSYEKVNGEALAMATHKLLEVSKGVHEPDDRDSLTFKEVVGVEDFIPEKIIKNGKTIKARLRQTIDHKTSIGDILSPDLFNRPIHEFFTKGGSVTERSDQTNPVQMLSAHRKTTLMSKELGGIKGDNQLTTEMQVINPSHMGFLDPMHTPECSPGDTEVYTRRGWVRWDAVQDDDEFLCQPGGPTKYTEGFTAFRKAERFVKERYAGLMYCMDNGKIGYIVTPNHRVLCRPYAKPGESALRIETADLTHGKPRMFPVAHKPIEFEAYQSVFALPKVDGYAHNVDDIEIGDWSEFMGWFLSEGSVPNGQAIISQCKRANEEKYERIRALLHRLPFGKWCEPTAGTDFRKGHKQLATYLEQFGYCQDKFIPPEIFTAPVFARERFVEAMLLGDGRTFSRRQTGKFKSYKQKVYCTTSPRLAADFEKLCTELGYSVMTNQYSDRREERYLDVYEVRLLKHRERVALPYSHINAKRGKTEFVSHYSTKEFDGLVYSATVPGGLLFLRRPGRLGIWSGNSERTGITLHLGAAVRKNGKDLETPVYDLKTGKIQYSNVMDFHHSHAVLPDQVVWKHGKPVPIAKEVKMKMPGGAVEIRPYSEAKYIMPTAKGSFDYASNLIPFLNSDQGNRVSMADKQMEQAISLKHREAPLVQSKTDGAGTFETMVGHFVSSKAPADGHVTDIKDNTIHIKGADGTKHQVQLYDHFPLNDPKGMMHSEPLVKPGDKVKRGQIVADSNFTRKGELAIGTNLRVGYIPYKGYNYEDGIVISESASKKLTSEHLYKKDLEIDPVSDVVSKSKLKAFAATRSAQMPPEHWEALGEDGIVKPGTRVLPGQVLVAAVAKNSESRSASALAALGKRAWSPYKDKSLTWDEDHVGLVTKVVKNPSGKGFKVYVKTEEQAVVGDKLSGRHGNKGIITQILPDHEMPHTGTGDEKRHLEVLLNPSGVPTRINSGQLLETAAAKIAEKTGKTYVANNFEKSVNDHRQDVLDALKAHGLTDEEMVYDPKDVRKPLGSVSVGPQYLLKLKHQVEKKLTVRGGGTSIDGSRLKVSPDMQPNKGGEHGGQGFGALDTYALLGHNARANLREMATYKSDLQDANFWTMIQEGHEPPPPKPPFTYEKFTSLLKAMGVNTVREGSNIHLVPLTNRDILKMAGNGKNEIKEGNRTLRSKDLKPEPGGLFDQHTTGGLEGDKWGYIRLAEPMPNPIFYGAGNGPGPIPVLLGLKMKELDQVMSGKMTIEGKTGGHAVEHALKKIDVQTEIDKLKAEMPHIHGSPLDRANKKLKYLLALKDVGLRPDEAYILHNIPVLPPKFRPATPTMKGDVNLAPINGLYKNLAILNKTLKEFDHTSWSDEHKHPLRENLWESLKALQGIGKYRPVYDQDQSGNRALTGIVDTIATGGNDGQPKEGYFQDKLVKRRQNMSIRSTIIPEPALGIDEVGLPKGAAMELYKPYVVAQLGRYGMSPLEAQKEMKKSLSTSKSIAWKALEKVIEDRPLLLKRDPVLHKFSVMAFKPKLTEGKAIQIHPLVTGGFNADFDGDTMAGTVPMSREAVEEAKKMFPSKNLFSPTTGKVMYTPSQEALLGLHVITNWGKSTGKKFKTVAELEKAVGNGDVKTDDVVHVAQIGEKPTTMGRILMESRLPRTFPGLKDILHDPKAIVTAPYLRKMSEFLAKNHTDDFPKVINALKDLGNEHAYRSGYSFGLKDLATLPERDGILRNAHKLVAAVKAKKMDKKDEDAKVVEIYTTATDDLKKAARASHDGSNRLKSMIYSGARGKEDQLRQMIAAPMLMQDSQNRTIPLPVTRSYSEGLDFGDYWLAQHGARKGTLQRAQGTSEPGALSKDILNSTMSTLVVSQDCGTNQGVLMSLVPKDDDMSYKDVHDRYTAASYKLKDGKSIKAGTLLTPEVVTRLRNSKIDKVLARSPMKCSHGDGICSKCYGLNENGKPHDVGTNIGVLAGQALGEPAVQMAMDAFHSGGIATGRGAKSVDKFTRLRNLLEMPQKLRDEATLSTVNGKVTSVVNREDIGGRDVMIEGERHYVPEKLVDEKIKPGMEVKKGQQLSSGYLNFHKYLAATKDIHAVQNHLVKEMHEGLYDKEDVRRRNVEVVVRGLTNLTKVKDPGHSDWYHGDVVARSTIEEHNRNVPKGKKLVEHEPILVGSEQIPTTITQDWMARLNYRNLASTIQQGAAQGWKSNLHGNHPIPGIAHGAEFGKPPAGTPKHRY